MFILPWILIAAINKSLEIQKSDYPLHRSAESGITKERTSLQLEVLEVVNCEFALFNRTAYPQDFMFNQI